MTHPTMHRPPSDHEKEYFVPSDYEVMPVSFTEAKRIIETGHYTRSLKKGRFCFGVFSRKTSFLEGAIGAAVYGQPSGRNVAASIWDGGNETNTIELLRLWIADGTGKNAESWFLAKTVKMLPPEVRVVVAYSAPAAGHYGACYQAANWRYLGRTTTGSSYYYTDPDGAYVNKRIPWQYGPRNGLKLGDTAANAERIAADILGLTRVDEQQKMVYVYCLDKKVKLTRNVLPYPKMDRATGEISCEKAG